MFLLHNIFWTKHSLYQPIIKENTCFRPIIVIPPSILVIWRPRGRSESSMMRWRRRSSASHTIGHLLSDLSNKTHFNRCHKSLTFSQLSTLNSISRLEIVWMVCQFISSVSYYMAYFVVIIPIQKILLFLPKYWKHPFWTRPRSHTLISSPEPVQSLPKFFHYEKFNTDTDTYKYFINKDFWDTDTDMYVVIQLYYIFSKDKKWTDRYRYF